MDKLVGLLKKYKELLLYLIFGVATTAVNFVIYSLLVKVGSFEMTLGNTIAWCGAVIFAFITNKVFVFESHSFHLAVLMREFLPFLGARALSGVVEIFAPTLLYSAGFTFDLFAVKGLGVKAVVSIVIILLNYVFSKWIVFKKKDVD